MARTLVSHLRVSVLSLEELLLFFLCFYLIIMCLFHVLGGMLRLVISWTFTINVVSRFCTLYFTYDVNDLCYRLTKKKKNIIFTIDILHGQGLVVYFSDDD